MEAQVGNFVLASHADVLPTWPRRGLPDEMYNPSASCGLCGLFDTYISWLCTEDAACLLRCSPDHDATNGFFVSCFVRSIALETEARSTPGKRKARKGDEVSNVKQPKKKKQKEGPQSDTQAHV